MMLSDLSLLLTSTFLLSVCNGATTYCDSSKECVGSSVDNGGSGHVYSRGYKANYGSTSDIYVSGTQLRAYIEGAFGAYQIGSLVDVSYYINVYGVGGTMDASSQIDVYGASGYSAAGLAMSQYTMSLYFYCYAHRTCDGVTIDNARYFTTNQGAFSIANSVLNSGTSVKLYLRGYYAGYNTTLHCESGDTCDIQCYGNGCYGLFLDCVGSCTIQCNEANSTDCPLTYGVDSLPSISSSYDIDFTSISLTNDDNCDTGTYSLLYDDYGAASASITQSSNSNLCCRASNACKNIGSIVIDADATDIICSGYQSCQLNDLISNVNGGNIYCGGYYSCSSVTVINGSDDGTIYCGGTLSCSSSKMYNAYDLYCDYAACTNGEIHSVSNVYITAYQAATSTEIYSENRDTNVHLLAYQSGDSVTLYCYQGDSCSVNCFTNGACDSMVVYECRSNVNYICDESNGIACPTVYENSDTSMCTLTTQTPTTTVSGGSISCNQSYECVGQDLDNGGDGFIYSRGYRSNYGSTSGISVSGTWQRAYVDGAFGAYQIGTMYDASYYITITGTGGLMDATNVVDVYGASGYGAASLARSEYLPSLYFYCYAHRTCDNIYVTNARYFTTNQGAFSLANSILYSGSSVTIYLRGYFAGYNTTLHCESGDTCNIECYGNGCYGLFLDCVGTCSTTCNEANSTDCPLTYGVDSLPSIESNDYEIDITTIALTNDDNCNAASVVSYDDHDARATSSVSQSSNANVCCRASKACYAIGDIILSYDYQGAGGSGDTPDIVCSGRDSCRNNDLISNVNGGNIFCSGYYSCYGVSIINSSDIADSTIYCGGTLSCSSSKMYNSYNLYCDYAACKTAEIHSVSNVYITAYQSATGTQIYSENRDTNVHLLAYQSGDSVTLYCYQGDSCSVNCFTNGACDSMVVYECRSNVNYICDESNGIACPTVYENSDASMCTLTTQQPDTTIGSAGATTTQGSTIANSAISSTEATSQATTSQTTLAATLQGGGSQSSEALVTVFGFSIEDSTQSYMIIGAGLASLLLCCILMVGCLICRSRGKTAGNGKVQLELVDSSSPRMAADTIALDATATASGNTSIGALINDYNNPGATKRASDRANVSSNTVFQSTHSHLSLQEGLPLPSNNTNNVMNYDNNNNSYVNHHLSKASSGVDIQKLPSIPDSVVDGMNGQNEGDYAAALAFASNQQGMTADGSGNEAFANGLPLPKQQTVEESDSDDNNEKLAYVQSFGNTPQGNTNHNHGEYQL